MRKGRGREIFICSPTSPQQLARIRTAVYLLNKALRSNLARGKELHLLSEAIWSQLARGNKRLYLLYTKLKGQEARNPWYGVKGQGAAPPIS